MANISQRKQDHIEAVLQDPEVERNQSGFDQMRLIHRALPELDYQQITTQTSFLDHTLSFPMLISSMTGGNQAELININQRLAEAAEACQVAIAVGSQRAMILDPKATASFQIRHYAPNVPVIANMGAVQLNYGFGQTEALKMIEVLQADALYLHLNPLQELIQPEGDTNFTNLIEKIAQLQTQLEIPIILKEVGCGFSKPDLDRLQSTGIKWIDLAGRGGSSWSRIESHRTDNLKDKTLGHLFQDWGITTYQALKIAQAYRNNFNFIASGGIRNGIDMAKSVIMGAQICGVAAPLLTPALESTDKVIEKIQQYQTEFQAAQFLLGAATPNDLLFNQDLVLND